MTYQLDTDQVISYLNGRRRTISLIEELSFHDIYVSVITCGEVLDGMQRTGAHDQRRIREFEEFLEELFVVPVSQSIAEVYARERSLLRSNGLLIPDNDIWIAATAIAHNLHLVSGDEHFARIDGLLLYPLDRE